MRNSKLVKLLGALGLATIAACAESKPLETVPPAPPEFEATAAPEPTETPASTERQEPIAPEDQVLFGLGSATLGPAAGPVLDDVAAWVQADPTRTILVRGQADASGSTEFNLDLSARRAEAVADYLVEKGVNRRQISITATGEQAAVVEPAGGNRRVVIYGMTQPPAGTADPLSPADTSASR